MGELRLYKKFYSVSTSSNSYTLITPTTVTAETYIAGSGGTNSSTIIESNISLTEEEIGIFYANLNPKLYSSDVTYDLVFYVQYTPDAPSNKKLITRFRISPINISSSIEFEINKKTQIEYEISENIQYEILGTYN